MGKDSNKKNKNDEDQHEKKENDPPPVNYFKLVNPLVKVAIPNSNNDKNFRFCKCFEYFLIFVGITAATISGIVMPIELKLFGRVAEALVKFGARNGTVPNLNSFANHTSLGYISDTDFYDECILFAIGTAVVSLIQWILSYIYTVTLNVAAERQVFRIRNLFLKSVLRQDISWYDTYQTGEFASRSAEDLNKLQEGIGEKLGMFVFFTATFLLCVINSFVHGWKLTLVMLSLTPITVISTAIVGKVQTTLAENELKAYGKSGAIAEEVLSAIRTVAAFGGEEKEVKRYDDNLDSATKAGIKRGLITAVGGSVMWFIFLATNGLAYWYGSKLVVDGRSEEDPEYTVDSMLVVYCSVMMGSMYMGQGAPYLDAFSQAKAAAAAVFQVINRVPVIDSCSEEGYKPTSLTGNIEFENVVFNFPSRPEVQILNHLNLKVNKGETVALVGESGCGKSTTLQLLQRFYDPLQGVVKLDGCDIKLLNVGWLREHIGIVGQEPILFGTTIAENIRYGREGATQQEVERAAKEANAHDFIMRLPKRYETQVGDRGTQLSGGQKQRVAIARALIKNPQILLLDEATSALDTESESVVQAALDKARKGRTTIIIAHRLSTIRNADKIAAFSNGQVVEIGTHQELMEMDGIYNRLVRTQMGDGDSKLPQQDELAVMESVVPRTEHKSKRPLSIISNMSFGEFTGRLSVNLDYRISLRRRNRLMSITEQEEEEEEEHLKPSLLQVLKKNKPEWVYILFGCIGSIGMGSCIPAYSLLFGDVMGALSNTDPEVALRESIHYSIIFVVIGVITGTVNFLQTFMFSVAGEYLTRRLRKESFAAMLKQEMGWFDNQKNSVGILCTRLSSDAASVQGATGPRVGTILQFLCTIGIGSVIALILNWKLALVSMVPLPMVFASTYLQSKIIMGQSVNEMVSLDKANKIAIEVISNIKTVASLHREAAFHQIYVKHLTDQNKHIMKQTHIRGLIYGFASAVPWTCYGISLFYGGYLVLHENLDFTVTFKVAEVLIYGTLTVGQALSFAPNYNQGLVSAARIFKLLERKPLIDSSNDTGLRMPENTEYDIHFNDVRFSYPNRPNAPILRGLDLTVPHGKVVALVGSSGCGKSTCIQLLERFYDLTSGCVSLKDQDISRLNIQWLRSQIGIVSQEPMLFDRTIAENIAYGDNSRRPTTQEIIQAAMSANAHKFITDLPQGYETRVGNKGTQLSGGQKQRIAIARALLRNPKILLLDEATSALDTESERVVQEALEEAQKGRTCITVAHRLSTIRDADLIVVINQGKVVEIGSHDQLVAQGGHYCQFHMVQAKDYEPYSA